MHNYKFIKDYKDNTVLRNSFFTLANSTFEIDFAPWYNSGAWQEDYICYSFKSEDTIISNASIHKMTITQQEKEYSAIQIGTVMTDPLYQKKGLAKKLIHKIIQDYQAKVDLIFLFANDTVLDFYPKFGFHSVVEYTYQEKITQQPRCLHKEGITPIQDFSQINEIATKRVPVSQKLGVIDNPGLIHFYSQLVFPENCFFISELMTIVFYHIEGNVLHLYDVISTQFVQLATVLSYILTPEIETISYYYIPNHQGAKMEITPIKQPDDTLFILGDSSLDTENILFPLTSHG